MAAISKYQNGETLEALKARFWSKVAVRTETECWPWLASKNRTGYGQFGYRGTMVAAHRVAMSLHLETGIDGYCVLHSCDNPVCCNPAHLSIGSQLDNLADMKVKGRCRGGSLPGDKNPSAVLTAGAVSSIKRALANGENQKDICKRHCVSRGAISKIKNGRTWKDVA